MSRTTFILMKTSNPKVGMLTEMQYSGSKVISRKSTGLKVNRKDWNQSSITVKPNASGANEINDYIKTRLFKTSKKINQSGSADDEQCAIQYMRNMIERAKMSGKIIEPTYIKYNHTVSNFEAICKTRKGNKISFNDLRRLDIIEDIIYQLKISRNYKNKVDKKNSTVYNYMSILSNYVKRWNATSGTQFPVNTQSFFSQIGKDKKTLAMTLTKKEMDMLENYVPQGYNGCFAQIRTKSIFVFQYHCAGMRIQDAFLMTNKQITSEGIELKVKKTNNIEIMPYNFAMAKAISPFYLSDFNELVESTRISSIQLSVDVMKNLFRIEGIGSIQDINLENLLFIKNEIEKQGAQYTEIFDSLNQVKKGLEAEITKRFFDVVRSKPVHFIFPYLNWEDFKDVHHNTSLFNAEHCRLVGMAENKHIRTLKTISNILGLPKLGGHTPRHTIANHLLDTGFSLVEIQSILLHAHPSTTMVYLKKRQPSKLANNTLKSFHAVMDAR